MKDDDGLFLKRSNYLEETYFSWSIVSISTLDIPLRRRAVVRVQCDR
jgi:hypothetical protein